MLHTSAFGNSSVLASRLWRLTAFSKARWPGRFTTTVSAFYLIFDHGFSPSARRCHAFADPTGDKPLGCTVTVYFIAGGPAHGRDWCDGRTELLERSWDDTATRCGETRLPKLSDPP